MPLRAAHEPEDGTFSLPYRAWGHGVECVRGVAPQANGAPLALVRVGVQDVLRIRAFAAFLQDIRGVLK
eukprot:2521525-Rhodomonas_salina.4